VRRRVGLYASDREFPSLTGRSGTQRARRLLSRTAVGSSAPWCPRHRPATYALRECPRALLANSEAVLASCSPVAARGDRWLLMAVRGHFRGTRLYLGPGRPTASGPAPCRGWPASGPGRLAPGPWFLTGVSVEVSRVKRDFACALTRHFSPVLVVPRAQSRLRMEGRTRTLSGPSPDLSQARILAPSIRSRV
jgi:hypothetical protein